MILYGISTHEPKVSVIIPTYKREKELKRALESVKNQTYKNLEILVMDDSPTPKQESFFTDDRVRYYYDNNPRGAPRARNQGIGLSTGDFVAFLDDDDTWEPTKIEKQVKALLKHKNVPLVITYSHDLRFGQDRVNAPPDMITRDMMIKSFNLSSTSSYMVRKYPLDLLKREDGYYFDVTLKSGQEYDLAIRLARNHDVVCVPEVLVTQYAGTGQISENWGRKIRGIMSLYKKYHSEYGAIDHVKTVGVLGLFFCGFFVGNKIYKLIIPMKEMYEK